MFAYHIGNRLQPLMISDTGTVCRAAAGVEQLLEQRLSPFACATLVCRLAASVSGHDH